MKKEAYMTLLNVASLLSWPGLFAQTLVFRSSPLLTLNARGDVVCYLRPELRPLIQ